MCANADALWWDSKEHHTTQRKRKNYTDRKKKKPKRFTNTFVDQYMDNISSADNDSDDLDWERSDNNIDILIDEMYVFLFYVFIGQTLVKPL